MKNITWWIHIITFFIGSHPRYINLWITTMRILYTIHFWILAILILYFRSRDIIYFTLRTTAKNTAIIPNNSWDNPFSYIYCYSIYIIGCKISCRWCSSIVIRLINGSYRIILIKNQFINILSIYLRNYISGSFVDRRYLFISLISSWYGYRHKFID